jgi:hypothetical protein
VGTETPADDTVFVSILADTAAVAGYPRPKLSNPSASQGRLSEEEGLHLIILAPPAQRHAPAQRENQLE